MHGQDMLILILHKQYLSLSMDSNIPMWELEVFIIGVKMKNLCHLTDFQEHSLRMI